MWKALESDLVVIVSIRWAWCEDRSSLSSQSINEDGRKLFEHKGSFFTRQPWFFSTGWKGFLDSNYQSSFFLLRHISLIKPKLSIQFCYKKPNKWLMIDTKRANKFYGKQTNFGLGVQKMAHVSSTNTESILVWCS